MHELQMERWRLETKIWKTLDAEKLDTGDIRLETKRILETEMIGTEWLKDQVTIETCL